MVGARSRGAVTLLAVAAPYRLQRLTTFTDPFKDAQGTGYHTVEGLYALASGGIFGVGLGAGHVEVRLGAERQHRLRVRDHRRGARPARLRSSCSPCSRCSPTPACAIARRSADPFVRLVAGAATIWLCGQAVINIGYVTGLLPVTGIPLPFISAGGTSLLATFFVLGMLVSFARHERAAVTAARRAERLGRRTRLERWLRIPVPRPYGAPKRSGPPPARADRARRPPGPAIAASRGRRASAAPPARRRPTARRPRLRPPAPTGRAGR